MRIERIELHAIEQPLVHPFRTSFGVEAERPCILVAVHAGGTVGWGECTAGSGPWYSAETIATAWHILHDFLAPRLIGRAFDAPADLLPHFRPVRGHPMAKAGLENALWDLAAQARGVPLAHLINDGPPARARVEVGVSIGIQPTITQLVARVESFATAGYGRIKCKVEPGWLLEPLAAVRQALPAMKLMADANSAFSLADAAALRALDELDLLMIEQPLAYNDIADHARLQKQLRTPICLDESIHSVPDMQAAIDLQACRLVNMKVARVGGLSNAVRIHDMARAAGIGMWCGGMLETGVGRATNIHLATLPNFVLPGDISATERYFAEDIADPPFVLNAEDSTMTVPTTPGLGVTVRLDRVARWRTQHAVFAV